MQRRLYLTHLHAVHQQAAATRIQAAWRGFAAVRRLRLARHSAVRIQAAWRGWQAHTRCACRGCRLLC